MPTMEVSIANDDQDNYVEWGIAEAARAANRGVGPGEVVMNEVGNRPYLGRVALSRSGVLPGPEAYIG